MKKVVFGIIFLIFTLPVFACVGDSCKTDGNVMDSNRGTEGDILLYDCRKGNTDVGTWADPTAIPSLKGADGKDGINGVNGVDGINGLNGQDGTKGDRGVRGIQGERGLRGLTGIGLKDRVELIGAVRFVDEKNWSSEVFGGYDVNNDISIVGGKITFKWGESYVDRELRKQEQKIKDQEEKIKYLEKRLEQITIE